MHHDCVRYYIESQALLVCIFGPHWADYIWREVLLKASQSVIVTQNKQRRFLDASLRRLFWNHPANQTFTAVYNPARELPSGS
jgi:leucyl-tRNA synthetase